jgi:5-methylcytosine-specific restriction endonuclease McrA
MARIDLKTIRVLVLNASYEGITFVSAKRAFTLLAKDKAVMEEVTEVTVSSGKRRHLIPAVIKLREYRHIPHKTRTLSYSGLFARDGYRCQYCNKDFTKSELTRDHIIPKSRGGKDTWENLVACCFPCNNKKGDRTPNEAAMPLARYPKPFSIHTPRQLLRDSGASREVWRKYLYYENDKESNTPVPV